MKLSPRLSPTVWCVGALVVVLGVLFHESLFLGKGLVPADGILGFPPWSKTWSGRPANYLLLDQYRFWGPVRQFVHDQVVQGRFPLWNPHLACGQPTLASMPLAVLYPINLLLTPVSPFVASGIAAFIRLLLAGIFTMMYMRRIGAAPAAALVSALVYSLCGFMIVWLGHPHVNGAILLPLLFYLIERQADEAWGWPAWIGFALTFGVAVLGGHAPTIVHLALVVALYVGFRSMQPGAPGRRRKPFLLAGALLVGVLVAAAQVFPYLEYYGESSSPLTTAGKERWANRLTPNTTIHFVLPYLAGSPPDGFEDLPSVLGLGAMTNFNERTAYAGVLTLFLAAVAVIARRCRFTVFYAGLGVLALAVVYGVPPLPWILSVVPVLKDVNSVRMLLFVDWSLAVLAGLGLTEILRGTSRRQLSIAVGFATALSLTLVGLWRVIGAGFARLSTDARAYLNGQLWVPVGALAIALLLCWPRLPRRWAGAACVAFTAIDLVWFAYGYNPSIPADRYYPVTESIRFLQADPEHVRLIGLSGVLTANTAACYGLDDVRGQDFTTIRRYEQLITGRAGDFGFFHDADELPPSFNLLNAKYVLVRERSRTPLAGFDLVHDGEIAIYRYARYRARALVVFDHRVLPDPSAVLAAVRSRAFDPAREVILEVTPPPQAGGAGSEGEGTARILRYEPDDVVVEAALPRAGFLLLLDTYFPGWRAYVDGREVPILRADYAFRAVPLPAGRSTVTFSYRPASFRWGVATSLTVIGALAGFLVVLRRGSR